MNNVNRKYIFKSERLGFRKWSKDDLLLFSEINADTDVMKYFPKPLTKQETKEFIDRLQTHYSENGYCYFATEVLASGELIGFIGLAYQDYKAAFNPAVDIGWRLKKAVWGNGYATEGAKRCLAFAFEELKLDKVISTCTMNNIESENVMKKIGMIKKGVYHHPKLTDYPDIVKCMWYEIKGENML